MIEEAKTTLKLMPPPTAHMYDDQITKLKQPYSERLSVFVYPLPVQDVKTNFDIGGLSLDCTIKIEMGHGSIRKTVVVLNSMFNAGNQP